MQDTHFYLGRLFDFSQGKPGAQPLMYNPADLTTHAVVTGMTGSGKTGLCVALMEEAALQGIPAILIDPKGDLTNLLLHFPDMAPQDFQPWLDADTIRRQGKSLEQAAAETAEQWKRGLGEWGISKERLLALKNAAQYGVFTPGSDAGLQVSVLASLSAPDLPWEGNREILREKIASMVTALLGLVGFDDVDPLRSREHILLSNIFETAWSSNQPLNLTELVMQVQNPPFDKLGAFPLDNFFPAKDRAELAMALNNILASPAFQSWREGQPLDIPSLLYTPDGRPRQTVFYLAHLSEGERMFFVTLLLSAFETWMRTQSGSSSLRALLYFDELFGYLPPQRNPPSKTPLLRMLKQARAFGIGLVLATQNPVDVDYKALSNAGSWFVGKLQTERDKERLLDGLESASGGLDRAAYNKVISALGKRVFLLHNIHEKKPVLFQSRWAMNFLAGPLTRTQIPSVNQLAGAVAGLPAANSHLSDTDSASAPDLGKFQPVSYAAPVTEVDASPEPAPHFHNRGIHHPSELPGTGTRPAVPSGIAEYFLPLNYSITEAFTAARETMPPDARMEAVLYRPTLLAAARVRFLDRRYGVDTEQVRAALVDEMDRRGVIRWEIFPYAGIGLENIEKQPAPQARFETPDSPYLDAKLLTSLQKDFVDYVYRTSSVTARANTTLKVYGGPDVTMADFRKACADTARQFRDAEIAKASATIQRQILTLQDRLRREGRELEQDQREYDNRKWEENATHAENVMGIFTGRGSIRKVSSSMTKRRMTEQAKAEIDESVQAISQFEEQIKDLEAHLAYTSQQINDKWASIAGEVSEINVPAKKSDVFIEHFGVAWMPYYLIRSGGELSDLPAFGEE